MEPPAPAVPPRWHNRLALLALLALVLAMTADVVFSPARVLSAPETDLAAQFLPWREFAAREVKSGNLPLWNPHLFGGAPYLGGFQSALLYPPNLLYLAFPVVTATNLSFALHLWLIGALLFFWARERGLSVLPAFMAGALLMFGGTYFPHLYAGHLSNLCTMAWAPLLFLSIDRVFDRRRWSATLPGMAALAMMLLAGHPQYVFFTGVAAAIYCLLQWARAGGKGRAALLLALLVAGGAALAAAQLGAGWQAARETVRSGGLSFETAAMFSFPPENFLTLLLPGFFGPVNLYWGRCYWWEMTFFFSTAGALLALYGAFAAPAKERRWAVTMTLILLALALGSHTPLFSLLYHYAPGFDAFRGWSKFTFQASLFFVLLAGQGLETLLRRGRAPVALPAAAAALGALLLAGGFVLTGSGAPGGWLSAAMKGAGATGESYLSPKAAEMAEVVSKAASHAAASFWISGAALLVTAAALALARENRRALCAVAAVAVAEVFFFAWGTRETFEPAAFRSPALESFFAQNPGDYRTFNLQPPNLAMSLGTLETWGYDPGVVKRYAEWMFFTQGEDPGKASQYLPIKQIHPLYAPLLRCRFAFVPENGNVRVLPLKGEPLPHLFLAGSYRVLPGRDAIFQAMTQGGFDPAREVVLEEEPDPKPESAEGTVRLTASTTDSLTIEADLPHPALLVITDVWTPGWRARDLEGRRQYAVLPADYFLRAIPLGAGHHRLVVEYSPAAWRAGVWISLLALAGYAAACLVALRRKAAS